MKTLILLFVLAICSLQAETIIIVNSSSPLTELNKDTLKKIYLNGKTRWDHGGSITLGTLKDGSVHENFLSSFVGKSDGQFRTFWKKQVFTGKGSSPKAFSNDSDMVKFIEQNSNAIGYIDSTTAHDSVKAIQIK